MPAQNFQKRIEQLADSMTPSEQSVAKWILDDPARASNMTISEMGAANGVAKSTISKFVQKLGYDGFREFRNDLLRTDFDSENSVVPDIEPNDPIGLVLEKTFQTSLRTVSRAQESLDVGSFIRAANYIDEAGVVAVFGFGSSASIARIACRQFQVAMVNAKHDDDLHMQHVLATQLSEKDCAVVFSNTGTSTDLKMLLKEIEGTGCKLIAITSNPNCPLAQTSDALLLLPKRRNKVTPWSNMSGPIAQLVIVDALYQSLLYSRKDRIETSKAIFVLEEVLHK